MLGKALVVDVATNLCKALGCALLGAKEKVVHVHNVAVVHLGNDVCQCAFAACAASLNGNDGALLCG